MAHRAPAEFSQPGRFAAFLVRQRQRIRQRTQSLVHRHQRRLRELHREGREVMTSRGVPQPWNRQSKEGAP